MTGNDDDAASSVEEQRVGTADTTTRRPSVGDRATFASRLSALVRAARASGVSVDGRWTISSYEVVISGQQVTILDAEESAGSDAN